MKKYLIFISILLVSCSVKVYDELYNPTMFDKNKIEIKAPLLTYMQKKVIDTKTSINKRKLNLRNDKGDKRTIIETGKGVNYIIIDKDDLLTRKQRRNLIKSD